MFSLFPENKFLLILKTNNKHVVHLNNNLIQNVMKVFTFSEHCPAQMWFLCHVCIPARPHQTGSDSMAERSVGLNAFLFSCQRWLVWKNIVGLMVITCEFSITQNENPSKTSHKWGSIGDIYKHIPKVFGHVTFLLSLSDSLVLPQLLEQLRLGLAAVRKSGGCGRCSCYQFRIQFFTEEHSGRGR